MRRAIFIIGLALILHDVPVTARGAGVMHAVIASGNSHVCETTADRKAVCWGSNRYGQLGNETTTDSRIPVKVFGLSYVAGLTAGDGYTCAVLTTGHVKCWGRNDRAQLANHTNRSTSKPVLTSVGPAKQIAAGRGHTCALLVTGDVICWGDNGSGQTGAPRGSRAKPSLPVMVPHLLEAIAVSAGAEHSCAVQVDGRVVCWGDNHFGQLGRGLQGDRSLPPGPVPLVGKATAVTAGRGHTCALMEDQTVQCWGAGSEGQLGDGTRKNSIAPVRVILPGPGGETVPLGPVTAISAGSNHTCALMENRDVFCWGSNSLAQVGASKEKIAAVPVFSGLKNVVALGAGDENTCAILSSGGSKCLGSIQAPNGGR